MPRRSVGGPYPANWRDIATQVKERVDWTCVRCGKRHAPPDVVLTVHHGDMDPSNLAWWNLWPLCARCHLQVQAKVILERPWFLDFTPWSKPYLAGWFAATQLGLDLPREEVESRQEEFLALYHAWVTGEAVLT